MAASTPVFPDSLSIPAGRIERPYELSQNRQLGVGMGVYGPDARVFARAAYHSVPVYRVKSKILNTLHKPKRRKGCVIEDETE